MTERLSQLAEILVALSGSPVPSQQFQVLADYASFVLPYDYLGIGLVEPAASGYLVHSLDGLAAGAVQSRVYGFDEGLVGQVLRQNRAFVTADFTDGTVAQAVGLEDVCARFGLRATLVLPIRQGTQAIGALLFFAKPPVVYQDDDLQIGTLLAAGLSASLETVRLYQALADERSTLAAVLGSTHDAVLVVNEQSVVLLANPAVQGMLGLDAAAVVGRPYTALDNPVVVQLFADVREGRQELALPNGRDVEVSLSSVRSEYGEAIGWAAVFHDIGLYKELAQMKNEFVNTVSHDLKNPISSINLAVGLMERFGEFNEQQANMRDRIISTTAYMSELISDLLDLGKIEAGLEQERALLDLVALITEVLSTLQPEVEEKQQQIQTIMPPSLQVMGDQKQLRQVLFNLIGNAIKYTPDNGTISVIMEAESDQVVVQVQDTGLGIPTADLPYVFDRFYRVSTEQTKDIKGTGLGLSITKSVVEAHNGRIWVESVVGQGSTFAFTLPLIADRLRME